MTKLISRLVHPAYLLIVLWFLMVLKTVEALSPNLFFNFTSKMASTVVFLFFVILAFLSSANDSAKAEILHNAWLMPLVAGGMIYWICAFLSTFFGRFGYQFDRSSQVLVGILFVALALYGWFIRRRQNLSGRFWILVGCCIVTTVIWIAVPIASFPLDGERSDMLPLIVAANKTFLAGGNPYQRHIVGLHSLPLTYLPMMWLTYAPTVILHVDPRWMVIPAYLGFIAVQWMALKKYLLTPWWSYLVWMALNPFLFIRHDIQVYPFWLAWAATLLFMIKRRWMIASILWGVTLLIRETVWFLLPLYLVFLLYTQGWRISLRCCLTIGIIVSVFIVPFALDSPSVFFNGVISYRKAATTQILTVGWSTIAARVEGFSLVPVLYFKIRGLLAHLELMQIVGLVLALGIMIWRKPNLVGTLQLMSLVGLILLLLNSLVWTYMYGELLILFAFAMIAKQQMYATTS